MSKTNAADYFCAILILMTELYNPSQIEKLIKELNSRFSCSVNPADYIEKSYSASSLADLLVQRYLDELTGEWTTEKVFAMLQKGLLNLGISAASIHLDAKLNDLIPATGRRIKVREWSNESGLELDILKPNSFLNGLLTFLFFAFIPLGIGMDWFFSGIGMAVCTGGIFLLNKTASNFRSETLGQTAETIAWKLYLSQQKKGSTISAEKIVDEVKRAMQKD